MSARTGNASALTVGERHRLTILFTDLVGSSKLARDMEAEQYSELLVELRKVWHDVVAHHRGHVVRTQGDGALVVFGYPASIEDGGRRAVEAALDIHERVGQIRHESLPPADVPLRMHSGVHAGTVLLADGDIERGRFDLAGDVVNRAAHLSQHAAPGQILASHEALGPHAHFFEIQELPRGADRAVGLDHVYVVLGRSAATRRFEATARRGLTPFIGRSEVVASLKDFLDPSGSGGHRCMVVVGEAGLGKTRLLEEALVQCDSAAFRLLRGGCESYLGGEVLQPFVQMLRAFFGVPEALPDDGTAQTTAPDQQFRLEPLGPRGDALRALVWPNREPRAASLTASGIVGDLLGFFAALSAESPLVLSIDDWQWADDASRQLLEALLQLPGGPRVILASRPRDDGAEWIAGATHLVLRPFTEPETELAVRRWLPLADPFLVARIHEYSGGVPLFIEELCHSASAQHLFRAMGGGRPTDGWLATLVTSRLERLAPDSAEACRAAAVIGNSVPLWLLAAACGRAPAPSTIQALADADFLYADAGGGSLRFKHGITRDAVYQSIGLHERRALHERIEAALIARVGQPDREEAVEALAHHSRGAGDWERAANYAERAGDRATSAFALDRAREQYQAAMDALERVRQRTREHSLRWCLLANKLGMTCIFDPLALGDDLSVFERAVALAHSLGDANAVARAQYWLGYMCYGFGRFREGVKHTRQALAAAQACGDPRLAAQIEATLGQILTATCQYDEAFALMDRALSAKQQRSRPGGGIAIGSAYTLSCKGSALADRGEFAAAHACFDEAIALLEGSTHPVANSVRNFVAVSLVWQGRWPEAERVCAESTRIAENTRALLLLAAVRAVAGYASWAGRGDPAGLQQLHVAMQWIEARHGQFYTSLYGGWLVEACFAEGDLAGARRYAAQVFRRAREGERLGEAHACRALAGAAARGGQPGSARRWLQQAEASARLRGSPREAALNRVARARALECQGDDEAARRERDGAVAELRALGMAWHAERVASGSGTAALQ